MPLNYKTSTGYINADYANDLRQDRQTQRQAGLTNAMNLGGVYDPVGNPNGNTQTQGPSTMPLQYYGAPSGQPGLTVNSVGGGTNPGPVPQDDPYANMLGSGAAGMANPDYQIQGRLPFSNAGANFDFSGNPASMSSNYFNSYNDALKFNAANYGNILGGFQQTMQNQLGAQDQLNQDYTGLGNKVQGLIAGTDQAQMQRVQDQYAMSQGNMMQGAIDRGLGNTTVTNALERGIELDRSKAQTEVQNQFAQLQAGYASNIGLAGLGQKGNNITANTNQANNQLGFMNSVNAPYPDPGLYALLAQQYGQGLQGTQDRQQFQQQLERLREAGGANPLAGIGGGRAGGGGSIPQRAPGLTPGAPPVTPTGGGGPGGQQFRTQDGRQFGTRAEAESHARTLGGGGGGAGGLTGAGFGATSGGVTGGFADWSSDTYQADNSYYWGDDGYMYYDDFDYSEPSENPYYWGDDGSMYYDDGSGSGDTYQADNSYYWGEDDSMYYDDFDYTYDDGYYAEAEWQEPYDDGLSWGADDFMYADTTDYTDYSGYTDYGGWDDYSYADSGYADYGYNWGDDGYMYADW